MGLSKALSNLKKQPSFIRTSTDQTNLNCKRLEEMITDWEKEYEFMDKPIKLQQQEQPIPIIVIDRPPSETPTIDKILLSLFVDNRNGNNHAARLSNRQCNNP